MLCTGEVLACRTSMVVQRILSFWQKIVPVKALSLLRRGAKMDQLLVRCVEGEEFMTISYSYGDKQSNMLRSQMETADKSLARIETNVRKLGKTKKNKKMKCDQTSNVTSQRQEDSEITCSLFVDGTQVGSEVLNKDAWVDGAVLHLGACKYRVYRNLPTILSIKLPNCILVGCPIYPRVEFEFSKPGACRYTWYREVRHDLGGPPQINVGPSRTFCLSNPDEESALSTPMETSAADTAVQIPIVINPSLTSQIKGYERRWVEVSSDKVYTPQAIELGGLLKMVCVPSNGDRLGTPKEVQTVYEVKAAPDTFPFERRHEYTKERTLENCFRVVSYNILADMYADSDFSRDVLYPYCPKDVLDIDYREQLLLKELTGYNADILCLQEVGRKLFECSLEPSLKALGLDGLLRCKHGNLAEGEAIFYRTDKFRLLGSHDIVFCEALEKDPLHRNLLEALVRSKAMLKRFLGLASIVQVAVFELISDPTRRLCVANTHLYFHPRAAHIRLIQTAVMVQHVLKICSMYQEQSSIRPAVILCGDLNSTPDTGVCEYLMKGSLAQNSVEWYTSGKEEFCGGIALAHPLALQDACKDIEYTNFVAGFHGKLDHVIFEGDKMDVHRVIPMSTHEEVTRNVALPNALFPSDHMALVCELGWNESV